MYLCVNDKKHYHSSAVYAAALHTISLPFRMDSLGPTSTSAFTSGALDINSIVHMLSGQPRQNMVAILDATMPAPSIGNFLYNPGLFRCKFINSCYLFCFFVIFFIA